MGNLRVHRGETLTAAAAAELQSGRQLRMTMSLNATHVGRALVVDEDGTESKRSKQMTNKIQLFKLKHFTPTPNIFFYLKEEQQ